MTNEPPDDDAFVAWLAGEPVQGLLRDLWEAREAARGANAPATREATRTALGEATGAFLEGANVMEHLQQQMVDHVLGEPGADAAFAGKTFAELTRPEMLRTRGGEAILRGLAERGVLTLHWRLLRREASSSVVIAAAMPVW